MRKQTCLSWSQHLLWRTEATYLSVLAILFVVTFSNTPVSAASGIVVPRDYPTIQAAVDAAVPGATIKVRSGTYTEQIVIAKDLTLEGEGVGKTIIQAPSTLAPYAVVSFNQAPVVAVVRITDGAHVSVSELTVTGPMPCGGVGNGIRVVKGSTLELKESRVTRIRSEDSTCTGFSSFRGIGVGLPGFLEIDGQPGTTGNAIISAVTVDQYQDTGIDVAAPPTGALSTATIANNTIIGGSLPFRAVAQLGIQLQGAVLVHVKENTVRDNVCTDALCGPNPLGEPQSVGILANGLTQGGSEILENRVSENDVGIYQVRSPNCCIIRENTLENNIFFGIVIQSGDGATDENIIIGGEVGIAVVAGSQDTVGVLQADKIKGASMTPIQELECCGFIATAIIEND